MAGLPGSPASMLPAGADEQVRRMRDLERRVDELGPSVARSVSGIVARLAEKVQTYRRVFTHAELGLDTSFPYPLYNLTLSMAAPSWATSGVVLAYTVPAWTGTLASGQMAKLTVLPVSTWNSNSPLAGARTEIYYDTAGAGSTKLLPYADHSHPVEVKGSAGFPTTNLLAYIWWVKTTSFPASGVTITLDTTVLWN